MIFVYFASGRIVRQPFPGMEICPEVKSLVQLKLDLNISSRKGKAAICMEKHKKNLAGGPGLRIKKLCCFLVDYSVYLSRLLVTPGPPPKESIGEAFSYWLVMSKLDAFNIKQ